MSSQVECTALTLCSLKERPTNKINQYDHLSSATGALYISRIVLGLKGEAE